MSVGARESESGVDSLGGGGELNDPTLLAGDALGPRIAADASTVDLILAMTLGPRVCRRDGCGADSFAASDFKR